MKKKNHDKSQARQPTKLMKLLRFHDELVISQERFRALEEIASGLRIFAEMSKKNFWLCSLIFLEAAAMAQDEEIEIAEVWERIRHAVAERIVIEPEAAAEKG